MSKIYISSQNRVLTGDKNNCSPDMTNATKKKKKVVGKQGLESVNLSKCEVKATSLTHLNC